MELGAVPAPRALPLSRLSYSALEAYRRCGYRFYLERVLGLPRSETGRPPSPEAEREADGLPKLLRGSLVHKLLEELDFRRPVLPSDEQIAELIMRHAEEARAEDVSDLRALVEGFVGSQLRERLAAADRVRAELPFAFTLRPPGSRGRSLLVNGVVDVHAVEGSRTLVVDYKSDPLEGCDPDEYVAGHYETQRTVYALAALKAGAAEVEVAYVLLERPREPVTASFTATDAERLELQLLELGRDLIDGAFVPAAEPHRELCAGCPGVPALCSWPPEMTLRD
jgi:ATP-dependent helicase/nuclease subunit A